MTQEQADLAEAAFLTAQRLERQQQLHRDRVALLQV
jgi:hypothetical protein